MKYELRIDFLKPGILINEGSKDKFSQMDIAA